MSRSFLSITVLVLLLFPLVATAGDWRVIPVRLDFDRSAKSGVIRLINNADNPLNIQVAAKEWTQDKMGQDVYVETSDLIVFPKILTIPPKSERILRTGIKVPAVQREKTYRIFIEEIPQPNKDPGAGVSVSIRFGLPVFVAPLQAALQGELVDLSLSGGTFRGQIKNSGNLHLQFQSLTIRGTDSEEEEVFSIPVKGWYLLEGKTRTYEVSIPQDECRRSSKLHFDIAAQGKLNLTKTLEVNQATCQP